MLQEIVINPTTVVLLIVIAVGVVFAIRRLTRRGLCDCNDKCGGCAECSHGAKGARNTSVAKACESCSSCSVCYHLETREAGSNERLINKS